MSTKLEAEWTAFRQALPGLLATHRDQFVLWRDARPIRFCSSYKEAYEAGLDAFGPDDEYLVAHVAPSEPRAVSIAWQAGVMFDPNQ